MRVKLLLLLPLLALAELKDVVVSGKINLLHYVAKELTSPVKEKSKVTENGLVKACKMEPERFFSDILFYVFECHSDVKSISVDLPGSNNYLDGYQVESFDVQMAHTESPQLKHVVSCPVAVNDPTDMSCSTYVLDFFRAAPDIATLESMGMSSKRVIVVEPGFNSGTSSYTTTVEIDTPFSISARTLQPRGRAGILAPEGSGLDPTLNGCDKAEQAQAVWEFPGFKTTGLFKFGVCAVAPDNVHQTWYNVQVNVTRHYSTRLRSLAIVGKELDPPFDPEVQQYTVHVDGKVKEVDLKLTAVDSEASIRVDADKTTHGNDTMLTTVKMHDNDHLKVGEPPQWSRSVSVQLESADGEKTLTYLVHVKQKVSNYSYLLNLSMDNTSCKMNPPKFEVNVTEYSCVFWWTETEHPRVIATMDKTHCPDCTLLIPSAREFPESHLSLQYQTQIKRVHESGDVWTRPFLYGEYHVVPFQVLSADKFTHTTYHVHLERDAPWWMKAATTRTISSWATVLATSMAIFSASNFVALTRMIQFMDLTTEIKGTPDVYNEFANHLKGFNFDPAPYLPDLGLPSMEDVRDMRNKAVQQLKDAFSVGDMKKSGTLVLQYCYALDVEGQLAANGILHTHPEGTKLLLQSLSEAGDMFKPTPEDEEVEKRKLVLNDTKTRTVFGAQGTNTTLRSLRGVQKYAGDVSGDVTKLRSLEAPLTSRRLDGDDKEEKKKKVEGPDSAMLVVQWTQRQWKEFIEKIKAENVTEDDYPNARKKIPCDEHPMADVVPFLFLMHELELIRRMMHTYTGTFLLMFIAIFSCGAAYITYYRTVMMKSQRRVKWLEPGFLSIFVLDCGLIGFTKSAAKIVSQPTLVTFFFWKPERWEVQAFVLAGVVLYPVVFVMLTYLMISEVTKPSDELEEEGEEGQETKKPDEKALKTKMVFNEDVEQWIDPTAREIKVTLEPPIPSWIPVLGEMITSHVRSCIPVLTVDGEPISFRTDVVSEEEKKVKPVVDKEKLLQEAAELEKKLNEELAENATDATKKDRTKRAETIKDEQETLKKIHERAQKHVGTVKSIQEEMGQVQETYCKEVTPGEKGPSGDPTWFPAEPTKPKEGEEEEEEFTFEKRSIFDLLTEWKSVKGREENEVLDAEESFAIRSYIEGHIRREKRLTKYNIMQVGTYKGYMLPKEPFNIVKKKDPNGKMISVRERADPTPQQLKEGAEPCPHWWLPKDASTLTVNGMEYELDEFGPSIPPLPSDSKAPPPPPPPPYIQNSQGQRLVYESGQMGPLWRFLGQLKVGNQEAGVVRWMDEPEDGWEVFQRSDEDKQKDDKGKKYANMVYADKWQWIYLDKWDLPWSGDDEEEKHLHFLGCWKLAKDDIPLFRIMEKALLKRFKTYVPKQIRSEEKNEIRQWMWKGLLGFTELKLKLGWMAKQHPRYKLPDISEIVTKPFDVFLLELAHAPPDKELKLDSERETDKSEELLNFTLMKFEDLFPDDEEPWWEESDKPADNERKVMFDHDVFFQDSGGDENENVEFKTRWKENKLIPEHGYYSSSCFTRFPEDTFGKKRYIVKKPDDPVESIARVEINVRLKHVLPLMRYTSHFKACVPINSLELPLRSNLQIILKESGNGEQFNYTVDRLTNLISIGVLASQPPGPVCAITLLLLQMVNFANRFYTNKESAKAVAKLMDEEEAKEAAEEAEKAAAADASEKEPLTGGDVATKKKKLSPMKERIRKKREAMKNKTLMDSFLEVEVFKMFLQSLVLFLLCAGQFGWMPGPICALMCILVCVFTMIFMNVSTFRKEMNKQIESISNSVTEFYRMYRGYENAVMAWLSGENIFGWKFFNFEGAHASNLENISDVNFVVPELGLRLTGKTVVDDLLPQDEKMKQQLLKYTAYFANLRADSRAKVKAASDLQRYHQDIAPSFTLALSVDQLKLCQAIPPIAATIQCVNHAGSTISSPDFDSYYTLYYPEAWEDEHDHDKAAVEQLTNTWKEEVKNWMDDSLGATYSDRTYTKKIQEHIAALMGMPFEHGRSRHCVMIKLEQTLIPDFVPLRTSCREKVFKEMENKMLFVTVLYEDEDFTVDMAYNRTSPLGRIVKLTPEKLDKLMYEGTRPDESSPKAAAEVPTKEPGDGDESPEPPAMMKTKSHFSIRPDMGKLKRFVALLAEEGEEPPIFQDRDSLDQFAFICEHEACEFKVPIPATVSKFKLMVWFQNNVDGQPTEELIGFSEPFDLILPDEAALMGEDQADQKRIPFYTSWHTTLTQGLKIIQADDPVEEAKTWFGRLKNQVREYLAPPITKTHVKNSTGFVDMSVRNLTAEELKIDKDYVDAMKDVTVGNSEINKSKLKRHLDRRGILSNFFGLRMEDTCIDGGEETLKAHLKRLEDFYKANQSGWTVELAEKTDMGGRQTKLENLLLAQDIRRSLWKNDDMEKAIESIKQSIEDYEKTKKKEVDANIKIYPRYRITQRYRGPRRVDQESVDFDTAMLSELKKFKQDQARTGKSILHYVMVADHLKHNKFWSPDAISPHVCGIIVNNTPDVPSVRLQCHKFNQPAAGEDPKAKISKDMVFHRETLGSSKELPAFVNGRLCFKATDEEAEKYYKAFVPESPETWKVATKGASEVQEWTPVYLYWDGFARWVVSPFRGEPAPYGLATDTNQNLFLYCRDQATTPDRISKTQFKKWENGMWKEDSSIRVLNRDGSMATKQEANRAEQLRVHAKSVNEDSGSSSWIGEMFKGLMFIFVSTTSKKSSPEIKECLIGLEGGNITIAWKDIHQESLAPLRTFLLDEFTTYQAAWVFLCRNCTIKKTVCVRNLARMLRRSLEGLQAMLKVQERIETQEKRKRMKAAGQMQKTFTNATAAQSSAPGGNEEEEEAQEEEEAKPKEEEKEPEAPAKSTLFSGFGRMMGKAAKSAKAAATGMAGAAKNAASAAAYAAMGPSDEAKRKENEKKMLDYLNRVVTEDPNYVEKICQEIMNQLDHDKDGVLVVKEILALPEVMATKTTNKEMKEFIKFLKVHPAWAKPEFFWAELSEGFEITLEEFTRDSLLLLQRFTKQQEMARAEDAGMSVEERCAKVFAQLDVQMSGGVGLNELIPMSGEDKKAAASNLAKFTVPLTFIKEIRIDKARTSGAGEEERQTVRFQVHPDFENSAEWKKVKKGLSPDWEPNHNFEYLQVAMVPQYLDMWKQVISDCGMDTVQEFVRFYNGSTLEHPVLDGVYMRHGEGTQRWPDGKTYKGYWENHVYEGPGKLFNDYEDMANDVNPIYNGDWKNGKRHGNGVLRWEQDNSDRARKTFGDRQFSGVRKIYDGEFQHDCFHGRGTMRLEKAVSQSLRTMDRQGLSPGRVPLPNMDPSYILSFDGLWESDWTKTDAEAREISPLYENLHPLMPDEFVEAKAHRDLKLDTVTKVERMQNLPHMRFARYFPLDPMEVQAAGDPLPDLALAYYQSKGGDANHMSDGFAVYADFTEYTGFFERGRPSGKGKMTQFDHKDGKKGAELASYDGYWKNGKFEGEGVYTTADGLTYKGSFKEHLRHGRGVETVEEELACKIGYSKYEGNWENGLFHGEGTLTYGDPKGGMGRVFYKGTFVEGKRTGVGRVFDVKDGHLKLLCKFENDKIVTSKSKEEYGWLCLDRRKQDGEGPGKYFYGVIGQDGELGTWGTLYSARAVQDPDFLQCVQEGKPYQKENPQNEQLQYILYHGQWKDSVPDGFGVQHFAGAQMTLEKNPMHQAHGGTYTGDFLNGKRHGRGVWKTTAGAWEFRPIANEDVPNWEKDLMHGIGIVEDFEHVHENVIYTKGKCQMPFTELGPPKTGFESAAFSDVLPQAGRKRIYVTPLPTTENPEEEKKSPEKENPIWVLLKGFGQKLHKQQDEGWEALDREHELAFLRATAKSMGHSAQALTRMNSAVTNTLTMRSMPTSTAGGEPAVAALVREPTDLSLPEEDVLIKGGTGENEVINGVYFKLMHTFGVKAFKMVKQVQSGFYTTTVVRYLYWDHVTSAWTISPKPLGGVCLAPGCAFAQEDNTEHPSMVTKPWYVWHGYTGELLAAGEEIKEKKEDDEGFTLRSLMPEPTLVDKLVAKSIVGFQVQGNQDKLGKIGMGLMLRIPLTLFGRPVYEYEGGGQYLYFHRKKDDGTMEDMAAGQDAELEEFGAGIEPTPERLYESSGCWVIATDMGIELESPDCYAVVEDTAVTPDQITRTWNVRSRDKMEPNVELRFTAQEWSHEGTLQAMVEQVEKEEREAEEAEEEESESQEEKKEKKKEEKTEKKEKKKKGWLG